MATAAVDNNNNQILDNREKPVEGNARGRKIAKSIQESNVFVIEEKPQNEQVETLDSLEKELRDVQSKTDPTEKETALKDLVVKLCDRYPEIIWLSEKTHVTPEGIKSSTDDKISVKMFGESHVEFDKTVVSVFCLFWVLKNDRASFIQCQRPDVALTEKSWEALKEYVLKVCPKEEDVEALMVFTVLNDLGKVVKVVEYVAARTGVEQLDHDKILWMGLNTMPGIFPSYARLPQQFKKWLLEGLAAQFNFAQFVQGESVPASLTGLKGVSKEALDLFNMHALFDMAGAAGQFNWHGSLVITEPTYNDCFMTIAAIETLKDGASVKQVYDTYLHKRAVSLGFDIRFPTQRALTRICCLLRLHTRQEADKVRQAYENLPADTWTLLRRELNTTGIQDGTAILLYYAPALMVNVNAARKAELKSPEALFVEAIEAGLKIMAGCFIAARKHAEENHITNPVFTADINDVAGKARVTKNWNNMEFYVTAVGEDGIIRAKIAEH